MIKVTQAFSGVKDGETHPTDFVVGDEISGKLAEVAVQAKLAKEAPEEKSLKSAPENK